jgi:hypothetical protein
VASVEQSEPRLLPEGHALFVLTRMIGDEAGARANWAKGFGFGYEVLMWKDGVFDYIDDIVYVFYEVHFSAAGEFIGQRLYPTLIKYHHLNGEYAFVQRGPVIVEGTSLLNETRRYLITPVYRLPDEERRFPKDSVQGFSCFLRQQVCMSLCEHYQGRRYRPCRAFACASSRSSDSGRAQAAISYV